MSSDNTNCFTRDNLDEYLKKLAKEFRKQNGTGLLSLLSKYAIAAIRCAITAIKGCYHCYQSKLSLLSKAAVTAIRCAVKAAVIFLSSGY